jgi:hypothetical protein
MKLVLDAEQAGSVRRALLIGLSLLGEWEERNDAYERHQRYGKPIPEDLMPLDCIGGPEGITIFANALRYIDNPLEEPTA